MFNRVMNLLTIGAVAAFALFGSVTLADAACGCCSCQQPAPQPAYYPPPLPPPQPVYVPQPVYIREPVYIQQPAPQPVYQQPVYQQPVCAPRRSWFERMFGGADNAYCGGQPAPVYIVNQGPKFSGPNVTVEPAPYVQESEPQPYPVVSPSYHSGYRYAERPAVYPRRSYRHRVSVRYSPRRASIRVRY